MAREGTPASVPAQKSPTHNDAFGGAQGSASEASPTKHLNNRTNGGGGAGGEELHCTSIIHPRGWLCSVPGGKSPRGGVPSLGKGAQVRGQPPLPFRDRHECSALVSPPLEASKLTHRDGEDQGDARLLPLKKSCVCSSGGPPAGVSALVPQVFIHRHQTPEPLPVAFPPRPRLSLGSAPAASAGPCSCGDARHWPRPQQLAPTWCAGVGGASPSRRALPPTIPTGHCPPWPCALCGKALQPQGWRPTARVPTGTGGPRASRVSH
ncbi:hypothetical protein HJG60_008319 [Phyllostomus discolor]|uniref:Uncharacterized protein n=1 Tax=Phyllostomus discolor TaxID=89673 RepID=A0A834DM23_9CHIR|nr:hypothetical protein HJG60_008319 [Phyllostomus discolor]